MLQPSSGSLGLFHDGVEMVQEKSKLMTDIQRLRKHFSHYEPTIKELRHKYEVAMKEKMLMRLERDRMAAKVEALDNQVRAHSISVTWISPVDVLVAPVGLLDLLRSITY